MLSYITDTSLLIDLLLKLKPLWPPKLPPKKLLSNSQNKLATLLSSRTPLVSQLQISPSQRRRRTTTME
jgi:hypothetical protein